MSTHQIEEYYNKIKEAKLSGHDSERNIRRYFYELLKTYTKPLNIKIEEEIKEYATDENNKTKIIYPDGRIKKGNMIIGWVENKDAKDDLYKEIRKKQSKQYPLDNTIFENSKELVLYQNGKEVNRINILDSEKLDKVLIKFVNFKPEEYKKFQDAFVNLKRILPELAEDLRDFFKYDGTRGSPKASFRINHLFRENLDDFTAMCQRSINHNITEEIAIEMIIQHMLTRDIFVMLFYNQNFHRNNIISKSIEDILENINQKSAEISRKIDSYMHVLNSYTSNLDKKDKQDILKTFYSDFYKALNSKKADVQGIEYTPIQIVKFMVEASERLLYRHFNKKLSSKNVNILDPCSGTGIFMAEIIDKINLSNLEYKYKEELFSNEIDIMPYYISNLNIENAYYERTNNYEIFENMCFLDTLEFQIKSEKTSFLGMEEFNKENVERAIRQYKKKINLIIGNPPYNANQKSENDNNKNKVYSDLDRRIKETYINESTAQKTKQYDMYKRFIRWASDRIHREDDGIIAFITNNAYLDSRQDDGFRKTVQKEFDYIYIVDLKGNARKRNKAEGGNVFNIQTGVAIMFLIKKAKNNSKKKADIKYYNVGDYLSGEEKLMALQRDIFDFDFEDIIPDKNGQWLNQTDNDFYEHLALIDKNVKNQKVGKAIEQKAIFKLFSLGIATNRDDWAYDFDKEQLTKKVKYFLKIYNKDRNSFKGINYLNENKNEELDYSIKWSRDLKKDAASNKEYKFNKSNIRESLYRPFVYSYLYFDDGIIDVKGINNTMFPKEDFNNISLTFTNPEKLWKFANLVSLKLSDLHVFTPSGTINAPLYIYENGEKKINITDYALKEFQKKYKEYATHENIFAYCHAILSSPKYQKKYEENLKTDYPRIPFYSQKTFNKFVELGKRLIKLQTEFENLKPYTNLKIEKDFNYMPKGIENPNKNKFFDFLTIKKDKQTIILDAKNIIENIPKKAFDYKIGTRCALDWIVDYYKPKKLNPQKELHHASLIDNDLTNYDWKNIREYLFDLIPKVIAISVEIVEIFEELERLEEF